MVKRLFQRLWRKPKPPQYNYYVVENSFVARIDNESQRAQCLMDDGRWLAYNDVWDVCTNGRWVASEEEALAEFVEILALRGHER